MRKTSLLSLFVISLFVVGCTNEDSSDSETLSERFFKVNSLDQNLQNIAFYLQQKNDSSDFVSKFVDVYGYPLWKDAVVFPENGNTVYAVPVKSLNFGTEIEAIWFFSIGSECTNYHIYTRKMGDTITRHVGGDGVEDTWMFDYFTRYALHKEPVSGLIFESVNSRGWVEEYKCVHMYAGVGDLLEDKGTHCWISDIYFFDDSTILGDSGSFYYGVDGDVGAGGGGSSSTQQGSEKANIEKGIKEKLKNCGFATVLNAIGNLDKLKIAIDKTIGKSGEYNPQKRQMTLQSENINVEDPAFIEELIHFMQDMTYDGGIYQYVDNGKTNIEFEAKVIQDLFNYTRDGKYFKRRGCIVLTNILEENITFDGYIDFLKSIGNGTMANADYFNMLNKFNEYTTAISYKGSIKNNLNPLMLNLYGDQFAKNNCNN